MNVEYVADTSHWKEWQRDYRLGLILIMPPGDVGREVNRLRAKYDPPAFASCPAHITLSDPLGVEMTSERESEIGTLLNTKEPFELYFDKPQASRERAGVAYPIRPVEPIYELREVLHQASVFTRPPYWTRTIPPHMTIAEFVSIEESWRILEEIQETAPSGSFLCDRLEFIVPDKDMHFQRVKSYMLGHGQRSAE